MSKFEIKPTTKTITLPEYKEEEYLPVEKKAAFSKEEKEKAKKEARYYLPVLYLNQQQQWESKPLSERKHFTDEVAKDTCLGNCCGHTGLRAGCCQMDMDDLEHVLGPIDEQWISSTLKKFKKMGMNLTRYDLVIDYEEGKLIGEKFFNSHPVFDSKGSYPILRFQVNGIRFACKFLNVNNGMCTIYEFRPPMCQNYFCSYIKSNFLVKLNKSNTYRKLS